MKQAELNINDHFDQYRELNISEKLAHELALTRPLFSAMDIIEVAQQLEVPVEKVAEVYLVLASY